jgi:hypothetical protein
MTMTADGDITVTNAEAGQDLTLDAGELEIDRATAGQDVNLISDSHVTGTDTSGLSAIVDSVAQARETLTEAENRLAEAKAKDDGSAAAEAAKHAAQQAVNKAKANLEDAKAAARMTNPEATITAGGNVNILAGGTVNDENGNGLSVNAGGTISGMAGDDVKLRSSEDITLGTVSGKNTDIAATGHITGTEDVPNAAGYEVKLNAISLNGEEANLGTKDQPLTTDAAELTLTGTNIYMDNRGDLTLNNIRAEDDAVISTVGNLRQEDGTTIEGDDVTLEATKNAELGQIDNQNLNVIAGGSITENDDVDIETGSLNLIAGEDITLDNSKANNVTAEAGNDANLDKLKAATDVSVSAGNDVNLTDTTAGGSVTVEAGKDATLVNTDAWDDVSVTAGNDATLTDITVEGSVTVTTGGDATLKTTTTTGNVTVKADHDAILSDTGSDGNVTVTVDNNAALNDTTADGNVTVNADNGAILIDTNAGGDVTVNAGEDTALDRTITDGAVSVTAENGNATLKDTNAQENVSVSAGNTATLADTTGHDVDMIAGNDAKLTDTAANNVTVDASNNAILDDTTATGNVTATAGNDAKLDDTIATGNVTVTAGYDAKLGDTTAAGDVTVTAGNDATLDGTETNGNISVEAQNGNVTLTDSDAEKDVNVSAENNASLKNTKANDATVTAGKDISLNDADASGIKLNAQNDISMDGVKSTTVMTTAGDDILAGIIEAATASINAGGNISRMDNGLLKIDDLTLQAIADIGSREKPIIIDTALITASGHDIWLINLSDSLMVRTIDGHLVDINTAGSINTLDDGLIRAHTLEIHAVKDIGEKDHPMRIAVDYLLILKSQLGKIWFVNAVEIPTTVSDRRTGLSLYGAVNNGARLSVLTTTEFAKELYSDEIDRLLPEGLNGENSNFTGGCPAKVAQLLIDRINNEAAKLLWNLIQQKKTLYDFVFRLTTTNNPVLTGEAVITIPLKGLDPDYHGELEGKTVYVLASVNGELICLQAEVRNGMISVSLDALGMDEEHADYTQFVIVYEDVCKQLLEEGLIRDFVPTGMPWTYARTDKS